MGELIKVVSEEEEAEGEAIEEAREEWPMVGWWLGGGGGRYLERLS